MNMAKDPAFLFYSSDFLTGTMFLSHEQVGIYIRLLCSQHQHGGIIDKISFNSLVGNHEILRSKFIESDTGFYNERLANEVDLRSKKSNNMSQTAKEVWEKRKSEKEIKIQKQSKCITNVSKKNTNVPKKDTNVIQSEDENEDVIVLGSNNKINKRESFFSDFPNSSYLESVCRDLGRPKDEILSRLSDFRAVSEAEYNSMAEFSTHLKRWINKNPAKKMGGMVW
jgi:uncharacterized protein YdaU (DUF1376 family)